MIKPCTLFSIRIFREVFSSLRKSGPSVSLPETSNIASPSSIRHERWSGTQFLPSYVRPGAPVRQPASCRQSRWFTLVSRNLGLAIRRSNIRRHRTFVAVLIDGFHAQHYLVDVYIRERIRHG